MPNNKKHHYVPRLLLSKFSNGLYTNSYDLLKRKFRINILYTNQCQKDYLYGKNLDLELSLGKDETNASIVINSILENDCIPKCTSREFHILVEFICLQLLRTQSSEKQQQKFLDILFEDSYKSELHQIGIPEDYLSLFSMKFIEPYKQLFRLAALNLPLFFDLVMILVKNETQFEFVLSDNPCFVINRFTGNADGTTGISNSGVEILLPISPRRLIILSDPNVYELKEHIDLNEKGAIEINAIISSYADRLLFTQNLSESQLIQFTQNITESAHHLMPRIDRFKCNSGIKEVVLKRSPKLNNELPFFNIKPDLGIIPILRTDPDIKIIHKKYCEKILDGELVPSEWRKFFFEELTKIGEMNI